MSVFSIGYQRYYAVNQAGKPESIVAVISEPQRRINKVIDYIVRRPAHPHGLEELASIAHYSEFHFHRVFKKLTRQTPLEFIKNQRLSRAARILAFNPRQPISLVASAYGFSSAANFSKAFRPTYNMSPRDLRGNVSCLRERSQCSPRYEEYVGNLTDQEYIWQRCRLTRRQAQLAGNPSIDSFGVSIRQRRDLPVVYIRNVGPYLPQRLEKISRELRQWVKNTNVKPLIIGIPKMLPSLTLGKHCMYDICAVVPDNYISADINLGIIDGGTIAVFRCRLNVESFYYYCRVIWRWLTYTWLPCSGYQPADQPAYEIYLESPAYTHSDDYLVEFCIPIRPMSESVLRL